MSHNYPKNSEKPKKKQKSSKDDVKKKAPADIIDLLEGHVLTYKGTVISNNMCTTFINIVKLWLDDEDEEDKD
ncbi:hypothetical protein YDYSY3_38080 [Paenibacillus chitinolyticus]|uniref:hypothetical protein n=1 Tax=Paenibacillus chitinolyticus TaxID=79263 RepID=UPI0026E4E04C|nr:hypothetical protein [Paenibacillus chitinolyticus]GKS12808.1 hypothetical protein YDYSY3_38080 [Paenibacillus chitinolyticus]